MKMNRLVRILKNKWLIIGVSVLIIYTLSGFFLLPYLVRHYVPKLVHEKIHKKAEIGEVRFNPYIFTFEANDFSMDEPDGRPITGFKRFFVDFELKSLFKRAWTFQRIALESPRVNAVIEPDGALNLARLVPASETPPDQDAEAPSPDDKKEPPPRLLIEDILIDQGRIDFMDQRQSVPAAVAFKPFNLHIENLTTLPEQEGGKTITATSGDGEILRWNGNFTLNPVTAEGTVAVENLRVATIWKFFRDAVNLDMPEGKLTITTDYHMDLGNPRPQVTLANLNVALTGMILKLAGVEEPFLEMPDTRIRDARLDLIQQRVGVGKVSIAGGRARIATDESGVFNMERIIKPADGSPSTVEPSVSESKPAEPWKISLNAFEVDGFALDYHDASRDPGLQAGIGDVEVDLKLEARAGGPQTELSAHSIAVGLSGIAAGLGDMAEPAVRIDQLTLEDGAYDLAGNRFTLKKLSINGGGIDFLRYADGTNNLTLMAEPPKRETVAEKPEEVPTDGPSFGFRIDTVAVSGLEYAFSDFSVKPDRPIFNLEDIALVYNNVDGKSPMTFDARLKVRQGGQIKASGEIHPSVPSVQADIQVDGLQLPPFQPYIDPVVSLVLQSGAVSTHGTLLSGIEKAVSRTSYEGEFKVEKLRLIEPGGTETFLGWKNLQTENLKLRLEPNRLEIGQINLAQLAGKFIIYEDHTLNVVKVIKTGPGVESKSPAPPETKGKTDDSFPVAVRKINLSDGRVEFADLSLRPPFGTKIHDLKGSIVGISTVADARAQIHLDGRVDDYGTAKVEGELNSSDPKAFTDMGLVFRNLEMTSLTPYSGRFAGRKIDSGKLSVDLKYLIENSRLAGDNQIVVERLKLGEKIESPDAVSLPLDLAVALMEDSKGVIDIGLPVKGNLDSPEFSFGRLIWKALTNLLTKIVTSPFRALGALIPGGGDETLNMVVFEAGRSDVPPPEKEKLHKLTEALKKRPRLKITVTGRYHPETDTPELRSESMRLALALRRGQKLEPGEDPGPVDWSDPKTGKELEKMFVERFGADPLKTIKEERKEAEKEKKKDPDALKVENEDPGRLAKILFARLAEAEPIGEKELTMLARERTDAVMAELGGPDGIPEDHLGIKPPASAGKKDPPSALLNLEPMR